MGKEAGEGGIDLIATLSRHAHTLARRESVVARDRVVLPRPTATSLTRRRRSCSTRRANSSLSVSASESAVEERDISDPTDVAESCEDDLREGSPGLNASTRLC